MQWQTCSQLIWHSSTEVQGRQFTLNAAAVHWCLVTAHLYAEWIFKGVSAVAQTWCQLVWHSSTEEQGRQFTLNSSSALVFGDCTHVCRMDLHRCNCSGTNLLSADLVQQHRRTRHAVYPKHSSSALVFGDCTHVCRMDLHRCKCSGARLLSAGLAQQHRRTRQAVYPKQQQCTGVW